MVPLWVAGVERQRAPGKPSVWGLIDQRFASVPVDPSQPSTPLAFAKVAS